MSSKGALRKEVLARRDLLPINVREAKGSCIFERLSRLPEFRPSQVILFYAAFRSEVPTASMIDAVLKGGKRVVLPRVFPGERVLKLYEIHSLAEVRPGFMKIPEPFTNDDPVDIEAIDLVILPGVAFDARGNRLGYGGGYYDRLLGVQRRKTVLIGICYEEQLVESIPHEKQDVAVDAVVTDQRVIRSEFVSSR